MNRTVRRAFCVFSVSLGLFSASHARALDARAEAALARMAEAEKSLHTLRLFFTQTTFINVTGEKQVLTGKASFKRPAFFRVEHLTPRPILAVSDGTDLWVYSPERNQVMTDRWENWARSAGFPQGLGPFQQGAEDLSRKYDVSYDYNSVKGDVLKFIPKDPGAWPYTLRLTVDVETGLPRRTELESQTLKTVTEVQSLEVNPSLDGRDFIFKTPAGAEVFGTPAAQEGTPKK